ncbi:AMP-binding enzyme [Bradyrhizobium sp. Rc3b]|uniref:AMP-binding protein n=1 Tax=Bradyrhizobium sp. Rc3b TaxID=1855322 RepID=UPI0008E1091D|nr:AMP-binding protein [Bradyrhizobium sp. Rc3b]SFN93998.1 AMP-binding enzyme [Bradyrhizobium sp. Rc3b]
MANNLRCLIAACGDKPLVPIEGLSCLSASEPVILHSLDGSIKRYESECPLVEALEQISVSYHGKVAYFGEFREVTFGQLRERVLRDMKVEAGDLVAMIVDPSPDVAAVILAAGGLDAVAAPIAPDYPHDRIQHIPRDSLAKLLVHATAAEPDLDIPSICLSTLERCSRTANSVARWFPFGATDVLAVQKSACLMVDYEVTRHLCTVPQQELMQTINEFSALNACEP